MNKLAISSADEIFQVYQQLIFTAIVSLLPLTLHIASDNCVWSDGMSLTVPAGAHATCSMSRWSTTHDTQHSCSFSCDRRWHCDIFIRCCRKKTRKLCMLFQSIEFPVGFSFVLKRKNKQNQRMKVFRYVSKLGVVWYVKYQWHIAETFHFPS